VTETMFAGVVERLAAGEAIEAAEVPGLDRDRFATQVVGLQFDSLSLARVTAHLDADRRHHQPFGLVNGGVWCTVVETVASIGASLHAAARGEVVVGVSNSTDFLRPHRDGRVLVEGTPVHVGRTQQLWQVVLTRADDGKTLARGQVRLQALPTERAAG